MNKATFPHLLSSFKGREADTERVGCWKGVAGRGLHPYFRWDSKAEAWRQPLLWKRTESVSDRSFLKCVNKSHRLPESHSRCQSSCGVYINRSRWQNWKNYDNAICSNKPKFSLPTSPLRLFLPQASKPYLHSYKICLQSTSLWYWSFSPCTPKTQSKAGQVSLNHRASCSKPSSQEIARKICSIWHIWNRLQSLWK